MGNSQATFIFPVISHKEAFYGKITYIFFFLLMLKIRYLLLDTLRRIIFKELRRRFNVSE